MGGVPFGTEIHFAILVVLGRISVAMFGIKIHLAVLMLAKAVVRKCVVLLPFGIEVHLAVLVSFLDGRRLMLLSLGIIVHLTVFMSFPRIVNLVWKGVAVSPLGLIVHLAILVHFARIAQLRGGGVLLGAKIHLAVGDISRSLLLQQITWSSNY